MSRERSIILEMIQSREIELALLFQYIASFSENKEIGKTIEGMENSESASENSKRATGQIGRDAGEALV